MRRFIAIVSIMLFAAAAAAETVDVSIIGSVEYNNVSIAPFGAVMPGDAVEINFRLDSNNFVNSASFPTRGYVIDTSSFVITLGAVSATLFDPYPFTPYFVIRDNDPAVDGFLFSNNTDFPGGLRLNVAANGAGTRFFESRFLVTYEGTRLPSLDIMDALGTYDYTGLSVFGFAIDDLGFDPIGIEFVQMTISAPVAVEAASWGEVKALFR